MLLAYYGKTFLLDDYWEQFSTLSSLFVLTTALHFSLDHSFAVFLLDNGGHGK